MRREDRKKAALLEGIMRRHTAREERTLYELQSAGFGFQTVGQAYKRLKAQRTLAGFSQEQIDVAILAAQRKEIS